MKDNSAPAFPITHHNYTQATGMTLRDYFAAKAMQTLMMMPDDDMKGIYGHLGIAKAAYEQADEMLKARES